MNLHDLLHRLRQIHASRRSRTLRRKAPLQLEALENRCLPSCNTISGFVYVDANQNGLFDAGEKPLANSAITLLDANRAVVATTATDPSGGYALDHDPRISTNPKSATIATNFSSVATDWNRNQTISQFDPALGTLTAVEIVNESSITSHIQVENLSQSPSTIRATVAGTVTLSAPGIQGLKTNLALDDSFGATGFDGVMDFNGGSGHDFLSRTANGSNRAVISDASALAAYTGSGSVLINADARGSSMATGSANLLVSLTSTATTQVRVTYHYIPSNCLLPGSYSIVQTSQPPGFFDGQETAGNAAPIPNSAGADGIAVTLGNSDLRNNNFGEYVPASLAGIVYFDRNNNGAFEPGQGEAGIAGASVRLSGINDVGTPVSLVTSSSATGAYSFDNLRPSNGAGYTVTEVHPAGYFDGKDTIGSPGGQTTNEQFNGIVLRAGVNGVNNNFGELLPASLAGNVFVDRNNNGIFEPNAGDEGIPGATVRLTGTDDIGNIVSLADTTDGNGAYRFDNLRPSNGSGYALTETQPGDFLDGKDAVGTAGGTKSSDQLNGIVLGSAVNGINNNFGELIPGSLAGFVFLDNNDNGVFESNLGEPGIPGVRIHLTGTDDVGNSVDLVTTTAGNGAYQFGGLRPSGGAGYVLTESHPLGYVDGKESIGSQGGSTGQEQLAGIQLGAGANGVNNNFGELLPAAPPSAPSAPPSAATPPAAANVTPSKSLFLASQSTAARPSGSALTGNLPTSAKGGFTVPGEGIFVTGADAGGGPNIVVFNAATKQVKLNFFAYDPAFTGGVRVAVGDVNGDGYADIICAAGPGGGPDVKVFNGKDGSVLYNFFAYDMRFTGGVNVAAGDVNGDGAADIICGADAGGGPNITVFDGRDRTRLYSFFAYDSRFTGGVRVAAGDVNGDGNADIVCGAGPGGGPNVTVFSGKDAKRLQSFFAFDAKFTPGIYVAAGDVNGDGKADIIAGAGAGGGPNVAVFDGVTNVSLLSFFAYDASFTGGVRVAATDRDGDGKADIVSVEGPGGAPNVRAFSGVSGAQIDEFFAYNPLFTGGLYVGGM